MVWHVERMSIHRIPHNALHARFEGKRNKGRPRLRWIDSIDEDIESIGLTIEGSNGLDKGPRTMEVIHLYPSPPYAWRQELVMMDDAASEFNLV